MKSRMITIIVATTGLLLGGCSTAATPDPGGADAPAAPTAELSSNADLDTLTVDSGILTPEFAPAVTEYTLKVPNAVTSVTVAGTPADAKAAVSGPVTLGSLLPDVPQQAVITVTAENGATKSYTVEATRAADPALVAAARKAEVLTYITNLSNGPFTGAISGQNCFHGPEIVWGYPQLVQQLQVKTGEWVGILGVDYEFAKLFRPDELSQTNRILIEYAREGGLIAVTFTPLNPWVNDESDLAADPGNWEGPEGSQNPAGIAQVTSLNDLIDPAKPVNAAWMRKLDRIAAALTELQDAGVVVLFRPMQEMNGNWFWWGMKSHPYDPAPYANVYRHMRDYFTETKNLKNLIWVYSPNSSFGETNSSAWNRTVDWAYPGDAYVDVVAGTNYADNMIIPDYAKYVAMKKPLGIGEFGPTIGGPAATNGTWDTSQIIVTIKEKYPRIAFWVNWHSYPKQSWSLIANKNFDVLMKDPSVINRGDFTWSWLP
jgi:mannan endo-1,4-beta-mannosidase